MINFSRLVSKTTTITPEKYYQNLREGFEKHISCLYLEGLMKFPSSVRLRLSYAYFLNDVMNLKNHAISICYSCQIAEKSIMDTYHFAYQKSKLETFDNDSEDL